VSARKPSAARFMIEWKYPTDGPKTWLVSVSFQRTARWTTDPLSARSFRTRGEAKVLADLWGGAARVVPGPTVEAVRAGREAVKR